MSKEDIKKYQFTGQNQPSPEAKRRGWDVRRIKEMACVNELKTRSKLLDSRAYGESAAEAAEIFGIPIGKVTKRHALYARLYKKAMEGDIKAMQMLTDFGDMEVTTNNEGEIIINYHER